MESEKPRLLIMTDWFAPGYKAGGPIQSCVNLVSNLKKNYDLYVFTSNTDYQEEIPYPNIEFNKWTVFDETVRVYYIEINKLNYKKIRSTILEIKPQFIYLNSMFSLHFTIFPLIMLFLRETSAKVILAPRGMLQSGAVQYKKIKKKFFLAILNLLGIPQMLTFHATDQRESKDIKKIFKLENNNIQVIGNFPLTIKLDEEIEIIHKSKGEVKLIFISRIAPKKNLLFLLKAIKGIQEQITLTICGPIEDKSYWGECQTYLTSLPGNVNVNYIDSVPHTEIISVLRKAHFFILPTLGENFGHAIFEAFIAGLPVIISDQTPWKNLQVQKVGWDIPLSQPEQFVSAIEHAAAMDQATYQEWSNAARNYARGYVEQSNLKEKYLALFS